MAAPTSAAKLGTEGIPMRATHDGRRLVIPGVLSLLLVASLGDAHVTTRASVATGGSEANDDSFAAWLSPSGRFVPFVSDASNLVPGDGNANYDTFVRDRLTGTTAIVSVTPAGTPANGASLGGPMSADDRFILFSSDAPDVVAGDTNGAIDTFLRDLVAGVTSRVSVASDGTEGNGASFAIGLSADGRVVAFSGDASNLVPGDGNGAKDVFVRDLDAGVTARASVASDGSEGNADSLGDSLSADGRLVVFSSFASNLVAGDTNGVEDVFVHDRTTGITTRVSVASDGTEGDGQSYGGRISADGRLVAFLSSADDLVAGDTNGLQDVFVHDLVTGLTTRVNVSSGGAQADGPSFDLAISGSGRFVVFLSTATDLVPADTNLAQDLFVRDLVAGTTTRASVDSAGAQATGDSDSPRVSDDGSVIAFRSFAANLVAGDRNGEPDVFVRDLTCGNGVVDPGETCDDGNAVGGDGCENDCTPSICTGGTTIDDLRVRVKRLGGAPGDEQLTVTGRLAFGPGVPASLDPVARGAQLRLADLGAPGTPVLSLTHLDTPVPPGARGSGCDPADGWKVKGAGWAYANRSGAIDPPACTGGSAKGLASLALKDKRATAGAVFFKAKTKRSTLATPVGPLRADIVLGDAADGAAGACGTGAFAAVGCTAVPGTLTCR
jgi:cysteine-rich repeat protein